MQISISIRLLIINYQVINKAINTPYYYRPLFFNLQGNLNDIVIIVTAAFYFWFLL